MNKIILCILLFGYTNIIFSQETTRVSLDDLKSESADNNLEIRISEQEIELLKDDHNLVLKSNQPMVQLNSVLSATNTPLNVFGTRLQQARISQENFDPNQLNNPSSIGNWQTAVSVMQPILNMDVKNYKNASQYAIEAAKMKHLRVEEYVLYKLSESYIQLQFLYSLKEKLNGILDRSQHTARIANNAYDIGYAYQDDILKAEVRISEIKDQILEAEINIRSLSDRINFLSGRELGHILQPAEDFDTLLIGSNIEKINPNRADFLAVQKGLSAIQEQSEAIENGQKPRVNAFLTYEANLNKAIDGGHGYTGGVQMAWNLFDGGKSDIAIQKARVSKEKTNIELSKIQQESQSELNHVNNQNLLIKAKLETTQSGISQAKETLRISINRYNEGLEKTTDLIINEIKLSQREIELLQLILDHHINQNTISFIAG